MLYFWLAAMLVFIVIEAVTYALVSIWFAAGAAAGLIVCALGGEVWLQFVAFAAVSAIVLALLRPAAKKLLGVKKTPTNADAVLGTTALVTEDINNELGLGEVSVQGRRWSARSVDGSVILSGTRVIPQRIEGVKLFVVPVKENVKE